MQRRNLLISVIFATSAAAALAAPGEARADTSSWLSAGGGYGFQHGAERDAYDRATALTFSAGVGTTPLGNWVVGGLLRTTTYFSLGTDVDLSARFATGGFARGQWGLALDAGPGWRGWSLATNYGHFPLHAMILGGAPWGLQLGVGADFFNLDSGPAARGAVALLEIDFLRLTVMRQGSTDKWWENPSPAGGRLPRDPGP
ncbi:MAG TPA: hypothetical protein VLT33_20810 [Labilithrix sp.]|nr:hypothetical protein [Labilithrix sp.]